jgi:peptidoglycan/LPS O-acetylase OafA/YrhL
MHQVNIYSNTFCRLDGLMAGALLAVVTRSASFHSSKFVRLAWILFLVSVPLALGIEAFHERWIGFSVIAAASVSFIYLVLFSTQKWLQAILTNRFLLYTGTISYGIYLLEKIPLDVVKVLHLEKHPFPSLALTTGATYALAVASWSFLEKPFLKLKRNFEAKKIHADHAPAELVA